MEKFNIEKRKLNIEKFVTYTRIFALQKIRRNYKVFFAF